MKGQLLKDKAACIAFVERSPQAVATKNKIAWIGLFADGAVVEDPVGSAPHTHRTADGLNGAVGRFYQTFIAQNNIRFEVEHDVVCQGTVCRDLTIHIGMSDKVRIAVPMHLLYELDEVDGALRIQRLAAHWELRPMLGQQMQFGIASVVAGTVAFFRMLKYLGPRGVAGFSRAMKNVGEVGKSRVQQLAFAFNRNDRNGLSNLVSSDFRIVWGDADPVSLGAWRGGRDQLKLSKLLVAGRWITATAEVSGGDGVDRRGLLVVKFCDSSELIERCALYI